VRLGGRRGLEVGERRWSDTRATCAAKSINSITATDTCLAASANLEARHWGSPTERRSSSMVREDRGVGDLEWTDVVRRLAAAKIFWLHTTGPSGAPDAAPVWGVTVEDVLYFYSERSTVKARNLQRDPRGVVHLESGVDVVIVHGRLVDRGRPGDHRVVVEAFAQKYVESAEIPFLPSSDPAFDVLYSLDPRRALLWSLPDTEASTRRWRSPDPNDPGAL
jgi:hypothetical protein